jgi:hypothetical protein
LAAASWTSRVAFGVLTSAWLVNALLIVGAIAWIYLDGRSSSVLDILHEKIGFGTELVDATARSAEVRAKASLTLIATICVAGCTLLAMFIGLFIGPPRFRSIRAWLLFTMFVGGWLGTAIAGPEIYWLGQQRRLAGVLAPVETLARQLSANWPVEDGDLPSIGPYLAYPKRLPTCLLPLRFVEFPETNLKFSAVERTIDGTIRFELAGDELGGWLEWRADDFEPSTFVGGLEAKHTKTRSVALAPRWYLVRYTTTPWPLSMDLNVEQF